MISVYVGVLAFWTSGSAAHYSSKDIVGFPTEFTCRLTTILGRLTTIPARHGLAYSTYVPYRSEVVFFDLTLAC